MKLIHSLIFIVGFGLFAQTNVYQTNASKKQLYEYAKFTNVGKHNYTINDILNLGNKISYTPLDSENHSVGFTSDNYWLRFEISNPTHIASHYYLETARPITDIVNLYQINGATIKAFKSGDNIPFAEKQVKHRASIFKLELPPNAPQTVYIHYKSDGETINFPLKLYDEPSFWMHNYKQQLFLGLFYGLLFLAGIVYLFFYSSLKEKAFLYYSLYVFSIALMQAALDGFINEYIFPNSGYINNRAVLLTALCSNVFLLKYCEHFLRVNSIFKNIAKCFNAIYAIIALLFLMLFINGKTLELAYPISNINGLFSLLLILATMVIMRSKGVKIDPYFTTGIVFLVIGLLGFVMNNLSLLPNNFYTLNSAKFGSGFEVIFLSLSMTNLIRLLRLEKEKSQEEALAKSQEISALKTYFMSNISHELRTPINAIIGIADDALNGNKNTKDNQAPYVTIRSASLSLLSSINDIIDFERIEKNELELNTSIFNPKEKLIQISNNWKVEAEKKGLDYILDIDSTMPKFVKTDADRFVQIINNVLSNAVKFTHSGSIKFKVECIETQNKVYTFACQISDTGIGINTGVKHTIFDSFNQMKLNHSREFGGIGLGLTIAKHLVTLFNGSISIESEPNKGTDVYINLSLTSIKQKPAVTISNAKPIHILVVEDNKINQMVMGKILKNDPNITFSISNNGQEAVNELGGKTNYDLVLMDLQMPVMDGYEATEIIRSGQLDNVNAAIPIIAVTADATLATKKRVMALGINGYITKPIDKTLLFEEIYALLFKDDMVANDSKLRIA